MFRERLMDIVRKSIRDGYYTEGVEQLVDSIHEEIMSVVNWETIIEERYDNIGW